MGTKYQDVIKGKPRIIINQVIQILEKLQTKIQKKNLPTRSLSLTESYQ